MASSGNVAAWQNEPKGPLTVKETKLWQPSAGEVRIKILAVPLQPADAKQYHQQIMPRFKYPGILGSQCAGIVDKVGEGVSKFKVGDRVASGLNNYANGGDPARAAHQRYTIAEQYEVVPIGDQLSFHEAVALNTQTPPAALFSHTTLGMDRPVEPPAKAEQKDKKILIWGGSSAMGALSICYAKLAGYEVITTCSATSVDLVRARGADHIFERNDPGIAEKIKQLLPIDFWFDTISLPDSVGPIIKLATAQHERSGEDIKLLTLLPTTSQWSPGMPEIPPFLKTQMHFFRNKAEENKDHMDWLMGTPDKPGFMERGLKGGWLKGVPSKSLGGLDKIEEGLTMIQEGKHSAVKLVIEPWK